MIENITDEIVSYIKSYHPIIFINSNDEVRVDKVLNKAFGKIENIEINKYISNFIVNFQDNKLLNNLREESSSLILKITDVVEDNENHDERNKENNQKNYIFVLHNIDEELKNKNLISVIKNTALKTLYTQDFSCFFFIVSSVLEIPRELEQLTTVIKIPNPDEEEIKELINDLIKTNLTNFKIENKILRDIIKNLKGLTEIEIKKITNLILQRRGIFDEKSVKEIIEQKKQIIKKSNLLELIQIKEKKENIGGINYLKKWLEKKSQILEKINDTNRLDSPKGMLLVGVPGSGKSLVAQITSDIFKLPLLKLELGKILNKYVGESEANFHEAIRLAEAMSPCILWIDELEKAFIGAGSSNDSNGTTTRIFGFFLTWLQEKTKTIFVIATANNINTIPPEFSRKGRFDKIFYMGCPKKDQISEIFKIHFKKRYSLDKELETFLTQNDKEITSENLYSILDDRLIGVITGSDIEAIVQEAIESNFIECEKSEDQKFYGRDLKYFLKQRLKDFALSPNIPSKKQKIEAEKAKLFSEYDITDASER